MLISVGLYRGEFVALAAVIVVGALTLALALVTYLRARKRAQRDARSNVIDLIPRKRRRSA